jgi:ubiquinone biosynthesis protein
MLLALQGAGANVIEEALRSPAGRAARADAGAWIGSLIPVDWLVPHPAERWRPLVADALQFVFSQLSDARLAAKIAEQIALPPDTPPERRLIRLISRMPALQKIGQVLARNRRLAPELRQALTELENGITDVSHSEIRSRIEEQLGERLKQFSVRLDNAILSEASVSAVVRFSWRNQDRERERGVFKTLKPYIRSCYAEETKLLEALGRRLARRDRGYGFAAREIDEMLTEVRLLLERELDFEREQATLAEAARTYRSLLGVRVPRVIAPLCTPEITAMSEETGVKVTDAVRWSPIRQSRVAGQIVEALIAAPLFSPQDPSVFHADPHAGNLLYDEANRELIVLDWALAERLSLETRRRIVMLAVMVASENRDGVREAVRGLRRSDGRDAAADERVIDLSVDRFFEGLPVGHIAGVLDAMRLLDEIALEGVPFAAPLFLFRKSLFTLDGVLQDVTGSEVRMDHAVMRHFATRLAASFGLFYSPLRATDLLTLEWNAFLYPARAWVRRLFGREVSDSGRAARGSTPSPPKKSPRPAKARRPAPRRPRSRQAG